MDPFIALDRAVDRVCGIVIECGRFVLKPLKTAFDFFNKNHGGIIMRAYTRRNPLHNLQHMRDQVPQNSRDSDRAEGGFITLPLSENWIVQGRSSDEAQVQITRDIENDAILIYGDGGGGGSFDPGIFSGDFSAIEQQVIAEISGAIGNTQRMTAAMATTSREASQASQAFSRISAKASESNHPCAGNVVSRPLRSMCGHRVEDIRMPDGSVARRVVQSPPK